LRGQAFNFSNERETTVLELVRRVLDAMQSDLEPVVLNEASNEIRLQLLSAAHARRTLPWSPLFTLDEGMRRTVAWYEEFLGASNRPSDQQQLACA
jgi:CDP-glucose 4,6-dehydratase